MKCDYIAVETFYLLVILFGTAKGAVCYGAEFSEDVWECPDFENKNLKCDPLELGMVEGKDGELGLNGKVNVDIEIEDGTMMNVEIWKIIDIGKEYLYHAQGDICGTLEDDTTPWYPMINSMGISACPITAKSYNIKDMILNLEHAKGMMTHEMCGEYLVEMSMTKEMTKISCHQLTISVNEYEC